MVPVTSLLIALALQTPPAPAQTPRPTPAAAPRATAALDVHVTDRAGAPLSGATVKVEGPVSRDGSADRDGGLSLKGLPAGTYRLRFENAGFVTLEKEVSVKA